MNWKRPTSQTGQLRRLVGGVACLVYTTADFTWALKGRPAPPNYRWTTSGLNFIGFPTVPVSPPSMEAFFGQVASFRQNTEIFQYPGGELGPGNPAKVFADRTTPVTRGKAFWMRSGNVYNRYYGPFEIVSSGAKGVDFRGNLSAISLRLRNHTANDLTVTLQLVASEAPPAGQTAIVGEPTLLVRGDQNISDLSYSYTDLNANGSQSWTLKGAGQPGSEVEIVLGLNRAAITDEPGALLAGILRLSDSLGHTQVDLPVSATVASNAGLWVGAAAVTQVRSYLKSFQRDSDDAPVVGTNNAYVVTGVSTNFGAVARPFPLRLIVHSDNTSAHLLQHVFYGLDPTTNHVNATRESMLDPNQLASARRISAVHLPVTPTNTIWKFVGPLKLGNSLTATVTLDHGDQASNPFLHTYHPDHDNLDNRDKTFTQALATGFESYKITRVIRLTPSVPTDDFGAITRSGQRFTGVYDETVTFTGKGTEFRAFETQGAFLLNRINPIATLTTQ